MSTWQPSEVVTIDGRRVLSDSEEWRACCEAVHVLGMDPAKRKDWLAGIEKARGKDGAQALTLEIARVEPAYVLAMESKEVRRAYLGRTEAVYGKHERESIERRVVALWEKMKSEQAVPASA